MAGGKRKNGVIRGKRDGPNREEDLEQCSKAVEGLRGRDEWAGPQPDNWLCTTLKDGRKLVMMTHYERVVL